VIAPSDPGAGLAAKMRDEFDRAFSLPVDTRRVRNLQFLAVRIGGSPYALAVPEITGLQVDRTIVSFPAVLPELLGVAGIRGELVPVYSLAELLGYERMAGKMRWMALCGPGKMVGLAFDEFERHLDLSPQQIATADSANLKTEHIRAVAHADDGARPVISIPSVMAEIARRCASATVSKEK
jgi:chemotaxis signal transduction protein